MYKILIVDDEKMIRMGMKNAIDWKKLGVDDVFTAASGNEALKILKEEGPEILTLPEVAKMLRVSHQTIYNMIRDGRLKGYKVGREWRFLKKDMDDYLLRLQ